MGRLTTYDEFGEVWVDYNQCVNGSRDVLVKLAHYEDMEEQGRLIEQKQATLIGEGFICSECGGDYMDVADADAFCSNRKPNYCPWCGAKMSEVEE